MEPLPQQGTLPGIRMPDRLTPFRDRRLRVAVTTSMIYGNKEGGLQRYIDSIVAELPLDRLDVFLFSPACHDGFRSPSRAGIRRVRVPAFWNHPLRNILWHLLVYPFHLRRLDIDLLWLPELRRQAPLFPGKSVTTIHDMARYKVPGKYDAFRMFFHMKVLPLLMGRNQCFVAVSENTRTDVTAYLPIPGDRVRVIHNGIDAETFRPRPEDKAPVSAEHPYFLFVSRLEHPGKNHLRLIEAFERFSSRHPGHSLVLVGAVWLRGETVVEAIARSRAKVSHLGFVSDDELRALYKDCLAFVFPSLYEGFGLPLLEAMAAGAPVAAARVGCIPEVCGDAALYFDPEDVASIEMALERMAMDEGLRDGLTRKGAERVTVFSWRKSAERYANLFLEMCGERR
jgi:glycosyltransferase involved in cell wall biosynthesis